MNFFPEIKTTVDNAWTEEPSRRICGDSALIGCHFFLNLKCKKKESKIFFTLFNNRVCTVQSIIMGVSNKSKKLKNEPVPDHMLNNIMEKFNSGLLFFV